MSVQAIGWVLDHSKATGYARLVLIAIANFAGPDCRAWPSVDNIAAGAGIHRATVHRHLKHLVSIGELTIEERTRENGSRTSSVYHLVKVPSQSATPPPSQAATAPRRNLRHQGGRKERQAPSQSDTPPVATVRHPEPSLNLEGTDVPSTPAKPARARDAIFDALAKAGHGIDVGTPVPRQLGGQIGVAKRDLLEVEPDVRPEEIHRRAYNYRRLHPDWTLSATALVKHWHSVASAKTTADEARQADIARRQRF